MSGKGSKRRPTSAPQDDVTRRWEQTFGAGYNPAPTGVLDFYISHYGKGYGKP